MDTRTSNSDRPIARTERWGPKLLWLRQVVDSDAFRISFAVLVFAAALGILRQELQGQNFDSIARAFGSVSSTALLLAAGATVASYACLAVSERWALATIGRSLSPLRVALATFASYALSNGLGFSAATGGAGGTGSSTAAAPLRRRAVPCWCSTEGPGSVLDGSAATTDDRECS